MAAEDFRTCCSYVLNILSICAASRSKANIRMYLYVVTVNSLDIVDRGGAT